MVQGVGFRHFVYQHAQALGLTGYVRNTPDSTVDIWAEGDRDKLAQLVKCLEVGPQMAHVEKLEINWSANKLSLPDFNVTF